MITTYENKRAVLVSPHAVPLCARACVCVKSCSVCCTALLLRDGTVKMKVIRGVWSSPWGSKLLIAKMKTTSRNKERCK